MKKVIFENNGILEVEMITCFGVSIKENENPIGYFGTGLKYAIAILLRENHKIEIHVDGKTFEFGTMNWKLRDKKFKFVTMNGERLNFTTDLGKNWEIWMAFRELYSNTQDEGGTVSIGEDFEGGGKTVIKVEGSGILGCYRERHNFFLEEDRKVPVSGLFGVDIVSIGGAFFSKGVKVWDFEGKESLFSYNDVHGKVELSEDRQVKSSLAALTTITTSYACSTEKDIIKLMFMADENVVENDLPWNHCYYSPTNEFMEVFMEVGERNIKNKSLVAYCKKYKKPQPFVKAKLNASEKLILSDSINFLTELGYSMSYYPIEVVESIAGNALGLAKNDTIYLSYRAFAVGGSTMVKATLLEEWVHLMHGYGDCERGMQNFLFEEIIRLGEIINES